MFFPGLFLVDWMQKFLAWALWIGPGVRLASLINGSM
jgi:hypothetical protein